MVIAKKDEWSYSSNFIPIGIVVVPGSHNVYGNGSCGVMSLVYMDTENPDVGSMTRKYIYWSGSDFDTSLKNLTDAPYVGSNGTVNDTIQGVTEYSYLPSDNDSFTAVTNPYDSRTKYYYNGRDDYYAPSPYVKAKSSNEIIRNSLYYKTTSPSTTANCLADFDGVGNTRVLTSLATGQTDWKTASIENVALSGYYPAACCCWRYHTVGTTQGQWYLPSIGELGYVVVRIKLINDTIETLKTAYPSTKISSTHSSSIFWSSSEYDYTRARYLNVGIGDIFNGPKNAGNNVMAFLRV